ncbi:hypothetical protein FE391_37590 [Nonomuraea sp. KC401]|uniref:hypothetical protein n=1 Tax=unclassified Nonomuraea TaxID=2593643 RepID=UPI0010FE8058|nr:MULTISPECIES: hypothetical protein [unclassified Nonomuraea]NBE98928.1 hypothetical protein [Nonomuraea sp. K271]TLF57645.1 hypothetical protein FE391_37590 [Nonomuraea sp. KC401]
MAGQGGVMGRYLEGPDGLRVGGQADRGSAHWLLARMREPNAQVGEVWYKVTQDGHAIDVPGYYQLHELQEIVDLAQLREVDDAAGEQTA